MWAVAVGLVTVGGLVFVGWGLAPGASAGALAALRAGAMAWLLGHGAPIGLPGGRLGLLPLGVSLLLAAVLFRSGAALARDLGVRRAWAAATATAALAVPYAATAAILAALSRTPTAGVAVPRALVTAAAFATVFTGGGLCFGAGLLARWWAARRPVTQALAVGGLTGLATLLGGAAVLAALALLTHAGAVTAATGRLSGGGAEGGVTLLSIGYLPDLVVWAAAYATGAGFDAGAASLAPLGGHPGRLPALPPLAAVPAGGAGHLLVLLVPLGAGLVTGLAAVRRTSGGARLGATAGLVAAAGLAGIGVLARGPVGSGPPSGPHLAGLLGLAALELAGPAALAGWWLSRRAAR